MSALLKIKKHSFEIIAVLVCVLITASTTYFDIAGVRAYVVDDSEAKDSFAVGLIFYKAINNNSAEVIWYNAVDKNYVPGSTVIIPATVHHEGRTYNVTKIGDSAFANITSNKSSARISAAQIILPDNVKELGNNAFLNCGDLISITVPRHITEKMLENAGADQSVDIITRG
ncbi:hypothetical protein FACS1894105_12530 [Clostridia bacterium]|nr:hypothetical protein FACS1894105_12530 [Clostridia bacterium]